MKHFIYCESHPIPQVVGTKTISEMYDCCEFEVTETGRIRCKKHNQALIYMYYDGSFLCQVGEDEAVIRAGGIGTFNALNQKLMINILSQEQSTENSDSKDKVGSNQTKFLSLQCLGKDHDDCDGVDCDCDCHKPDSKYEYGEDGQ